MLDTKPKILKENGMKYITTVVLKETDGIKAHMFKIVRIGIDEVKDSEPDENGFDSGTTLSPYSMTATKTFYTERQARNHLSKIVSDLAYKCVMNDSIYCKEIKMRLTKEDLINNVIETLELNEIKNDDGEVRLETPNGYHVLYVHWIEYPVDKRRFAERHSIYSKFSREEIKHLTKNITATVRWLNGEHHQIIKNEYSSIEDMEAATRKARDLLWAGL